MSRAPLSSRAREILAEFASSFPTSAHYRGGRRLRKGGWESVFPTIAADVEEKERFLDAVEELERLGLVAVKWRRFREGSEVESITLESPEALYAELGVASPEAVRDELLCALDEPLWNDPVAGSPGRAIADGRTLLHAIRDHLRAELDARHPVPVEDARTLADLAVLFGLDPASCRGIPVRALSVRLYRDSKRLEQLLRVADRLSARVAGSSTSERLGLARSYPEASIALHGALVLSDGRTWECRGEPITLPATTIDLVASVLVSAAGQGGDGVTVLSVENKETFHTLGERLRSDSLPHGIRALAYCGGHPHRPYVALLSAFALRGAKIRHFGDLDPDGLLIFGELQAALPVTLDPLWMDLPTYRRYLSYGYRVPESRLALLAGATPRLPASLAELAREIIARRTGVEQECIDIP